jgi:hypothetical protein
MPAARARRPFSGASRDPGFRDSEEIVPVRARSRSESIPSISPSFSIRISDLPPSPPLDIVRLSRIASEIRAILAPILLSFGHAVRDGSRSDSFEGATALVRPAVFKTVGFV